MTLLAAVELFFMRNPFYGDAFSFLIKAYLAAAMAHTGLAFAVRRGGVRLLRVALAANAAFLLLDLAAVLDMPFALLVLAAHALAVALLWRDMRED